MQQLTRLFEVVRTVAIIPARGGSKGIKDKNIKNINGLPLIFYVLDACYKAREIDLVVVSTDSKKIARVVLKLFPETLIIERPPELSIDSATSEDAILHSICFLDKKYPNIEDVLLVQATSPLTKPNDLSRLLNLLKIYDSAAFYAEDYGFFFDYHDMLSPRAPRQERIPLKREAGNAWAFKKEGFLNNKSRLFGGVGLCRIDSVRALEIDEMRDIDLISCVLRLSPHK